MRILHVIATLNRKAGGPAESVRNIVNSYSRLGHEGEVVTLDDPSAPYLKDIGFPVHALGPVSLTFAYSPNLMPWLREQRHRFDGVVIHGLWQYLGFAIRRAFLGRIPYMVFTHGMLDPYFRQASRLKHIKKSFYWLLAEYWVLRDAERVLFTSEQEAELAKQSFALHRWRAQVVPYGAMAPVGDPTQFQQLFLAKHPVLRDEGGMAKPFILFLGRIHPKKGCDLLLDAFARLAARAPNLQLVFAGPDNVSWSTELVAKAEELGIRERTHWTGMLEGDQKWGALHACEAFALPSHQENFGIAVAEALACGKPVLISNKVNIWEQVMQDGAALVEEDDSAGTYKLLDRWISLDSSERIAMGKAALQCFEKHYDMKENARSIVGILVAPQSCSKSY